MFFHLQMEHSMIPMCLPLATMCNGTGFTTSHKHSNSLSPWYPFIKKPLSSNIFVTLLMPLMISFFPLLLQGWMDPSLMIDDLVWRYMGACWHVKNPCWFGHAGDSLVVWWVMALAVVSLELLWDGKLFFLWRVQYTVCTQWWLNWCCQWRQVHWEFGCCECRI